MRRAFLIAAASLSLAGCSSFSLDAFKSAPPTVELQLDSAPPGADARTSLGQTCKTPCSIPVVAAENFSVSFTLNKFQPVTVPVQVVKVPGDFSTPATTTLDPNPIVAELPPATPPKKPAKPIRRPKPKKGTATAPAESPFPQPDAPTR
jgi:hypothetical protein